MAAVESHAAERLHGDVTAHGIEGHVDAAAIGDLVHGGHEVGRPVVDREVGAELAAVVRLLFGARSRDDDGPERLADLHGARNRCHRHRRGREASPGLDPSAFVQREPTEMERIVHGRTVGAGHASGDLERGGGVDHGVRRVPAVGHDGDSDDAAADQVLGAEARGLDHTDGFHARNEGRVERQGGVAPANDVDVVEVEAEGLDGDADLVRSGGRDLDGLALEGLRGVTEGGSNPSVGGDRSGCHVHRRRVLCFPEWAGVVQGCNRAIGGPSCPPSPSTTRSCSPAWSNATPEAAGASDRPRRFAPTTRSRAPASRCGVRSPAASTPHRRPVLPARSARPGRVRAQRSGRRAVAPAPRLRDRHLRHRRRRRAPRLERWRRHHRRRRHAVDDRRAPASSTTRCRPRRSAATGGRTHGVQLWVNLPGRAEVQRRLATRRSPATSSTLLVVARRRRAGAPDRRRSRRSRRARASTHTPITYAHVSLSPGAQLDGALEPGVQRAGLRARAVTATPVPSGARSTTHQLVVFGAGDTVTVGAADAQPEDSPNLEVLLLGGLPIREPIAHYGPFLMNTRAEIVQAIDDFQSGRMGTIPAVGLN